MQIDIRRDIDYLESEIILIENNILDFLKKDNEF